MSTMFAALFSILIFPITITISQCMDKSSEITTLEQECGLQSSHTVYLGSSFDPTTNTWLDISGNCRNIETGSISNPLTTHPNALNGQTYISGTPITQILFPEDVLPLEWTFFHVARYNDGVEGRIFQGYFHTFISGFHGYWDPSTSGVALHGSWITQKTEDMHGRDWVFSTDQRNMYRSNGVDRTIASVTSQYANTRFRLCINTGIHPTQTSDFAIAAIIVFDYELSSNDYQCVEEYLFMKYNTSNPTTRPTNDPTSQPTSPPTYVPTTVPTSPPTTKLHSIQYIDGNVSCNNLHSALTDTKSGSLIGSSCIDVIKPSHTFPNLPTPSHITNVHLIAWKVLFNAKLII
eukprot:560776_1